MHTNHADKGIQYCSNLFTQILKKTEIRITEKDYCYENATDEREN